MRPAAADLIDRAYADLIAGSLDGIDPRRIEAARLHWRLALDLNSAVPLSLDGDRTALVLRQAKAGPHGALLRRSLVAVVHGLGENLGWWVPPRPSAEAFANPARLGDGLTAATEGVVWDDDDHVPARAEDLWLAIECDHRQPMVGAVQVSLLPGTGAWREQMDGRIRHTARRLAREARTILLGEPERSRPWNRREVEDDPHIRHFLAAAAMSAVAVLRGRLGRATAQFLSALDPQVVRAFASLSAPSVEDYRFFAAGGDDGRKQRRLQALAVYPLLARELRSRLELAVAIDKGRRLTPLLRRALGGTPSALKAVVGVTPSLLGSPEPVAATDLLTALAATPTAWHPKTAESWRAFRRLLDIPAHVAEAGWNIGRMRELGPDWAGALAKLGAFQRLDDLADYRRALLNQVIQVPFLAAVPDLALATARPDSLGVMADILHRLLDGRPLLKQLAASESWHRRQGELAALIGLESGWKRQLVWEPLTDPVTVEGITIVPLINSTALRGEGEAMGHCVGTGWYDEQCAFSGHHVVSMRDAAGRRLSTAELHFDERGRLEIVQHRGPGNAVPSVPEVEALEDYAAGIESGAIACDRAGLDGNLARRRLARSGREGTGMTAQTRARCRRCGTSTAPCCRTHGGG